MSGRPAHEELCDAHLAMCEEVAHNMAADNGGSQENWATRARICLRFVTPDVREEIWAWWVLLSDEEKFAACAGEDRADSTEHMAFRWYGPEGADSVRLAIPLQANLWLEDVFDGD